MTAKRAVRPSHPAHRGTMHGSWSSVRAIGGMTPIFPDGSSESYLRFVVHPRIAGVRSPDPRPTFTPSRARPLRPGSSTRSQRVPRSWG
jgi:hypothetical protein